MDKVKGQFLLDQLKNTAIEGICVKSFLDNGKSAAVYRGEKDGNLYAVKIFDNDLLDKYGVRIQQIRIDHELSLKDHDIDNLVKILGGGHTSINKTEYYYLIMEFINGINLKEYIKKNTITVDFITKVITRLINVSEKLLQYNIAHRDIKPENIMVSKNDEIILMDLGVLKIIGNPSMTDFEEKQFLGTLRYAPPEFLTRDEIDSIDGWRSINIYQIGTVLHDLIMKKELFAGVEPYTNLVLAIKGDAPKIINQNFPSILIQMARNMLQKDWKKRLENASIEIIQNTLDKCYILPDNPKNIFEDIMNNAILIQTKLDEIANISRSIEEKKKLRLSIHNSIYNIIDNCFGDLNAHEMIKSIKQSQPFTLNDQSANKEFKTSYKFYEVEGKFDYGFMRPVLILFKIENDDNKYCRIFMIGVVPRVFQEINFNNCEKLVFDIFNSNVKYPSLNSRISKPESIKISFTCIFDGILELEDTSFKNMINEKIASMLTKATVRMKPEVEKELESRKNSLQRGSGVFITTGISNGTIIIN
jgi:serine/threonine protein kinase